MSTKQIHPTMARAYHAAISLGLMPGENNQTEFANLLNASPQTVNNWESRGISKEGRLKIQQDHGINATWVETGVGEMLVSDAHRIDSLLQTITPILDAAPDSLRRAVLALALKYDKDPAEGERIAAAIRALVGVPDDPLP